MVPGAHSCRHRDSSPVRCEAACVAQILMHMHDIPLLSTQFHTAVLNGFLIRSALLNLV